METLALPLKLSRNYYKNRKRTNLNLDENVAKASAKVAKDRYGFSLSEMVNRLLQIECAYKDRGGLLNREWKRRRP